MTTVEINQNRTKRYIFAFKILLPSMAKHLFFLGLSAWIGYQDVDQDTHYQWTDNTDNDFTNLAKNCTETPDDPECAPQETAQQWYTDFMGSEPASYVCKMPAKVPTDVLANVTAGGLVHLMQTGTLYQVMQDRFEEKPTNKAIEPMLNKN